MRQHQRLQLTLMEGSAPYAEPLHSLRRDSIFVPVATDVVIERAVDLVPVHQLRASDAVQLASALEARAAAPEVDEFLSADVGRRDAARREGFSVPDLGAP